MNTLDFAKYLLQLNPQANAARLSLYHYFKNHISTPIPLEVSCIDKFYARALSFSHWRENRKTLEDEVKLCLESFLETYQSDIGPVRHASEIQVIELENIADLYEVIKNFMNKLRLEADRIRLLPDNENGIVAMVLKNDGSLFVHYFERSVTIRSGRIEPLGSDLIVKYDQNLEPSRDFQHHLQIQPGITARFQTLTSGVTGQFIRGYAFQKMEEFTQIPLNQIPALFYPLKKLERFFVNRATDPLYVELTSLLDQSVSLLREKHPDAVKLGSASFERGQNALNLIFPDDKLLGLLLRELSGLLLERTGQDAKWDQLPKFD